MANANTGIQPTGKQAYQETGRKPYANQNPAHPGNQVYQNQAQVFTPQVYAQVPYQQGYTPQRTCKYGQGCSNSDPAHLAEFYHPTGPSNTKKVCKFDGRCTKIHQAPHLEQFLHPKQNGQQNGTQYPAQQGPKEPKQKQTQNAGPPQKIQGQRSPQGPINSVTPPPPNYDKIFPPLADQKGGSPKSLNTNAQPFQYPNTLPMQAGFHHVLQKPYGVQNFPDAQYLPQQAQYPQSGFSEYPAYPQPIPAPGFFAPQHEPFFPPSESYPFYQQPAFYGQYPHPEGESSFTDDEEDGVGFLDEETEKYYDKFLDATNQVEFKDEFQRDWEEFLREQGCDVDGEDSEEFYDDAYYEVPPPTQQFANLQISPGSAVNK